MKITQERILWICNHRSKIDALLVIGILLYYKNNARVISKKFNKKLPIIGQTSCHIGSIFIERNMKSAEHILINKSIESYREYSSIFLFPEGATLTPLTKAKSDEYSIKNNLPIYKYLLLPKISGFNIISKFGKFTTIGNLTIKYNNPNLLDINQHSYIELFFSFPKEILLNVSYEDINDNLYDLFLEKDKQLSEPFDVRSTKQIKLNQWDMFMHTLITIIFTYLFYEIYYFRLLIISATTISTLKQIFY